MHHAALTKAAIAGLAAILSLSTGPVASAADADHPQVILDTTLGPITVELDGAKAPVSTENFLKYVDKGFYDGVVFHRVIGGPQPFMVQTGGMTEVNNTLNEKRREAFPSIKNESGNGLSNTRGTLAMARTSDPNSATSQFFINLADNSRLDNAGGGYAVFGKVVDGLEVIDRIAAVETTMKRDSDGNPHRDVPTTPVVVKSAKRKAKG